MSYINGYGLDEYEYSILVDKLYGFEEYYYYKQDKHYKDYLFVINELDKIKNNVSMNESYKNAILGWYIFFKNSKRYIDHSHICVRITDMCQLKCKHCYQQNTVKYNKYMTFDEFVYLYYKHQDIAKKFIHYKPTPLVSCDLEGGETTLNPNLCKIIQFLNNKNIHTTVLTNGLNISNELINTLKLHKHNKVQVSIDGLEQTHNFIRGEGTFKKSIDTIKKLIDNKINVNANIVLHELNYSELDELTKYMKQEVGCPLGKMIYTPQQNSCLKFLSKKNLSKYLSDYKLPIQSSKESCNNTHICRVGHQIVIDFDGSVLFCGRKYNNGIANYFTDTEETILKKMKTFTIRYRSVPVYCFDCKKVSTCLGGMLCNNNICRNGNIVFNKEDLICKSINKKDKGCIYEIR